MILQNELVLCGGVCLCGVHFCRIMNQKLHVVLCSLLSVFKKLVTGFCVACFGVLCGVFWGLGYALWGWRCLLGCILKKSAVEMLGFTLNSVGKYQDIFYVWRGGGQFTTNYSFVTICNLGCGSPIPHQEKIHSSVPYSSLPSLLYTVPRNISRNNYHTFPYATILYYHNYTTTTP